MQKNSKFRWTPEEVDKFRPHVHPHYPFVICCDGPMGAELLRWAQMKYLQQLLDDA